MNYQKFFKICKMEAKHKITVKFLKFILSSCTSYISACTSINQQATF